MLLAIDIGNTNINLAVFKKNKLIAKWRVATIHNRTADEYIALITQLMSNEKIKPGQIKDVIIGSVVPQILLHIKKLCRNLFDKDPLILGENLDYPIKAEIDRPEEVGADRIVNAFAATKLFGAPSIIVDFGTATTFDVVNAGGSYQGGVIAPGINLSLHALQQFAAKLPSVPVEKPEKVLGKNTREAMQSGIFWGYIGLVNEIVERLKTENSFSPVVIATGGLAPLFAENTKIIEKVEPELTVLGLNEIYLAAQ